MLSKPSWSVKSLQKSQAKAAAGAKVTQEQLHHLLRLSALPLPKTAEEEAKMIETLESQLHFVQAVQSVDTTGVEPLRAIRDETKRAEQENEINLDSLKEALDKEETVGFARRIQRKKAAVTVSNEAENWDILEQAPNKVGRYVALKTSKIQE